MTNLLLNRKSAVVALAATAVLGGGVAFAYPPGMDLMVSATASTSGANTSIVVSVQNANPSCATRIRIDNGTEFVLAKGETTRTISVPAISGRHSVRARTLDCIKGQKEHANSKFVVLNAQVTGAETVPVRTTYRVTTSGLEPGTDITVTATLPGTTPLVQERDTDTADRRGEAETKFKFTTKGDYNVVVTAAGNATPLASYIVKVT